MAAVVIVLVVFVVAQGNDGGSSPLNAIAKAADVTQRVAGGRAVIHATVTVSNTPEGLTESGSTVFDDTGRTRGTLTVRGHKTGREEEVRVIADGTKTYARSDALGPISEGKKWLEFDISAAAANSGSTVPVRAGPKEGLKVLEGVEDVKEVGKEDVDGVPTTRYRGTLPVSDEVFGVKAHLSSPQVDVWIDAQDRVRRMHFVITGALGGEKGTTTTEMTMDYVEFGRVPRIPCRTRAKSSTRPARSNRRFRQPPKVAEKAEARS